MTTLHEIGSLRVPAMSLGTMYFGTTVSSDLAAGCLDAADDIGASFWDTANNYAFWAGGNGDESETVLGEWFTSRGPRARDRITLATKVGARPLPGHADLEHIAGLSAGSVREQVKGSLRRLHTDRIDLLYAHVDDRSVTLSETLGAFGELIEEGLVREVAASNLEGVRLQEALATDCIHPYRALQQRFTFLQPDPQADTSPQRILDSSVEREARENNLTLLGYSPLLSGAYTRADREFPIEYQTAHLDDALRVLKREADNTGLDCGQMVLAWMVGRPLSVLPIVGASGVNQIRSAWQAVGTSIPESTIATLEDARSPKQLF